MTNEEAIKWLKVEQCCVSEKGNSKELIQAYARENLFRENLFRTIMKLDKDVVYYDTDSIKGVGNKVIEVVEEYNRKER